MTFKTAPEALVNAKAALFQTRCAALKAPPQINLPDWADTYRHLAVSAGSTGGPWRTSRVEVARGPMMAVTEPGVQLITLMVATQTLKTSLLENVIGYFAHLDPSPILLVQPKDESVAAFSKERLAPMVKATPVLKELIGDERQRNGAQEDTIRIKQFPGGVLAMVSAGSPTNLAMRAIRIVLEDEIDKYETTKEGDPVFLAEERLATFKTNKLAIRACSPTWEETSRIFRSYQTSDQRKPYVECPHCGWWQTLDFFHHVHWEKEDGDHRPETAVIKCESCKHPWSENERQKIITTQGAIRWNQTRAFTCCGVKQNPAVEREWDWNESLQVGYACCKECGGYALSNHHAGFQASKLYSPFITTAELAEKWIESKDDPESKQTFYNTQLGLPFRVDALKEVASYGLSQRGEDFGDEIPPGVVVITAGIDVQAGGKVNEGRLECEVVGWGLGEESWSLAFEPIEGDPAKPEVWKELDDLLGRGFRRPGGHILQISAACIDSGGHNTQEVYAFARKRTARNVWAIKGAADKGGQWSPIWPPRAKESKKYRTGFRPVILGVNAAKESIRQRLLIEEHGPGFCHFPKGRPTGYYEQMTAERLVIEKKAGVAVRKWYLPKGRANEALDCRVYAYAALWGLYHVRKMRLERQFELIQALKPIDELASEPQGASHPPSRQRVRRSKFMV